jgi:prepilin-type N-terminal cleavage/methylation domain-containing protein
MKNKSTICKKGFTLIELIIVIAIIAVIASIAASSALRARANANEKAVVGALKTVQSSSISYRTANGAYPASLAQLGAAYLSGGLESGSKHGYTFTMINGNSGETYTATAVPVDANFTGNNSFCTDVYNVIYVYAGGQSLTSDGIACPAGGTTFQS